MVTKKKSVKSVIMGLSLPDESHSVRVEKIDNGYLTHHSHTGKDGSYQHKTVYHPSPPSVAVEVKPGKKTPKGRK